MTTLLALDTATEACSVALLHDGMVTSHYEVIPRMHAQKLLPMIKQLLAESGVALNALDAIAFGRGPGAFTGVRIAIGVVQGLAFALERPVLPVSNLAALAQGALREQGVQQVAAAIDARMDEVYWGCFVRGADGLVTAAGEERVSPPEAVRAPASPWFGVGSGWNYGARLPAGAVAVDAAALPRASAVARLALPLWQAGRCLAAEDALPVYLRDNVAWTQSELAARSTR